MINVSSLYLKSCQILVHIILTLSSDHIRSGGCCRPSLTSLTSLTSLSSHHLRHLSWVLLCGIVARVSPVQGPGRRGPVPSPGGERTRRGPVYEALPGDGDGAVAGGHHQVLVLGHGPEHGRVGRVTRRGSPGEVRGSRGHPARTHPGREQQVAGARHPPHSVNPLPVPHGGLGALSMEARPGPWPGAVPPCWSCRHVSPSLVRPVLVFI